MNTEPFFAPNLAPLYAALARAIGRAQPVGKDAENTFHRYKYASAEGLIAEARVALAAEGLAVFSPSWRMIEREAEAGAPPAGYFADVVVDYVVAHAEGASLTCSMATPVIREKGRPEDKALATALTYNLGYFLRGLLLLPRVDAETDADQRDDRDYQPQQGRGGNGPRQGDNGHRDQGQRGGARLPEPQSRQQPPASGQAADTSKALAALAGAKNLTELEAAGQKWIAPVADGPQKEALRAAYRTRRDELGGKPREEAAPAAQAPEGNVTPIDQMWSGFCADIGAIVKTDTTGWVDDDFGAEFASLIEGATTIKDLEVRATPWIAAVSKRKGARIAAVRSALTRLFEDRKAQLRAASGA